MYYLFIKCLKINLVIFVFRFFFLHCFSLDFSPCGSWSWSIWPMRCISVIWTLNESLIMACETQFTRTPHECHAEGLYWLEMSRNSISVVEIKLRKKLWILRWHAGVWFALFKTHKSIKADTSAFVCHGNTVIGLHYAHSSMHMNSKWKTPKASQ